MPETIDGQPITVEQAQTRIDSWCRGKGDHRQRVVMDPDGTHRKTTVVDLAETEALRALPSPYPVVTRVTRTASAQALVSYAGNFYSLAPELARATVVVTVRHGDDHLAIAPAGSPDAVVARHRMPAPGTGATIRDHGHVSALNTAAMTASNSDTGRPHRNKVRIPPGPTSQAAAHALTTNTLHHNDTDPAADAATANRRAAGTVVSLERYAAAAAGRNTLTP